VKVRCECNQSGNVPLAISTYRPDIDGLRAFAIVPVLLFHAGVPGVDGGFVGVDVFFVISGYLISGLIYQELGERRFSILGFYERRARRIAPAFLAVSLLTFAAALLFLFPTRLTEVSKSLLWSSLAVGNVYFWQESGYFGPEAATQPFLHYWSLGVEEQFYLLFPALAVLMWKSGRARLRWVLGTLFILSLIASEVMVRRSPEATFYLLPFRAWELLLGSMLALPGVPSPATKLSAGSAVAAGIAMILASVFAFSEETAFPGISAMLPAAGSALVIWGGGRPSAAANTLGMAPLVYIGRISYSLYLVHWPVLFFTNRLLPANGEALRTATVIGVSVLLADLCYRFIETPTRNRSGFWKPARIFGLTAAGVAACVALSLATILAGGFAAWLPASAQDLIAYRYDRTIPYREGTCFLRLDQDESALAPECLPTSRPVALIWGDSHAAHFLPALKPLLEQRGYTVAQINASGCPPILSLHVPRRPHCKAVNDFAFDWISRTKPSLVVLSAIWPTGEQMQPLDAELADIGRLGARVLVLGPSPVFPERVPILLAERRAKDDGNTAWADLPTNAFAEDERLRAQFAAWRVDYVSIMELACPNRICPLMADGELYYWDSEHLTSAGARMLAAKFAGGIEGPER